MGMGISWGEAVARHGPSLMPGGSKAGWERTRVILEAAAARAADQPCVTWLGRDSAGHYVKMVDNDIEYGLMELIAETYDLMAPGLGLDNDALQRTYQEWAESELQGYLIEITADIFGKVDERSGEKVVDLIRDLAGRKATGAWATQDALRLRVPVPNIGTAVAKRGLSTAQQEGLTVAERWPGPRGAGEGDVRAPIETLRRTLFGAMVITYAQGMHQLRAASREYAYGLHLDEVVRVWRGGCIIRASLLEDLHQACRRNPSLGNPLADEVLAEKVGATQDALRAVARHAARWGIPAPGLMAALAYYDAYRSARLPAKLIQAQRDYFGAHGVELLGHEGTVHMH